MACLHQLSVLMTNSINGLEAFTGTYNRYRYIIIIMAIDLVYFLCFTNISLCVQSW